MEEEKEVWKDVVDYIGLYQVSNLGRVKSLGNGKSNNKNWCKERILKGMSDKDGYLYVNLCKDGKRKTCKVHRLVAEAFLDNSQNLPVINHKNEIKTDNRASNLEFCSVAYNNTYNGRAKKAGKKAGKKNSKPIFGINKVSGLIVEFPSAIEAERVLGIANQSICACCKGKLKSCGGFYWHYSNTTDDTDKTE